MASCLYLRKSRKDIEAEQAGEDTLARHEKLLLELAKKMNISISKIYKEVVSGETIAARPAVQELLTDVEQGKWDNVLVMEIERLARGETIDQGIIAQAFKYSNTKIVTPSKTYDPNDEFDEEYFEFGLFMSRREYKTINRRIQRGRIASVKEGKYISSVAPYGYEIIKLTDTKGYSLKINQEQANVVKLIYDLYINGELQEDGSRKKLGSYLISKRLDELGIKPMIKDTWSASSIRDVLKNPVYTGKIKWQQRKEVKKTVNGKLVKTRPTSDDYMLIDGLHKAIIDDDTFKIAQEQMKTRISPIIDSKVLKNPLSGVVYCKKCDTLLTRIGKNKKNKVDVMICPNKYCDNIAAPLELIESELLRSLKELYYQYKLDLKNLPEQTDHKQAVLETSIHDIKCQIDSLKQQLNKTYDLLEQGIYSNEVFLQRNKTLSDNIQNLNLNLGKLEEETKQYSDIEKAQREFIPKIIQVVDAYYKTDSITEKNEMLKEVIEKATYIKTVRNTKGNRDNANFMISLYPRLPQ